MVDADRLAARLARLGQLLEDLEAIRDQGLDSYLSDEMVRAGAERWLQLAIQICIDVGAQLAVELPVRAPSDYAEVFMNLAKGGFMPPELAERLGGAARQRNLLVHLYLEIDDREIFASLERLDDLREFARLAQELADRG